MTTRTLFKEALVSTQLIKFPFKTQKLASLQSPSAQFLRQKQKILTEALMKEEKTFASKCKEQGQKVVRTLWIVAGIICMVIGAIGIVLPILPTTPFLLAAAACYYKGSPRMHKWLLNNKWFGEYIRNYTEGKGLTKKTKITAITILWITIGFSTIFILNSLLSSQLVLPMQIIMIAVAIAVSAHILRLPTFRKTQTSAKEKTA
jgi:uncharacterized membrane protein YbaN (DUF454 family)